MAKAYPELTQRQKSIILGSVLGDGCVTVHKGCIQAHLSLGQSEKQRQYLEWKRRELLSIIHSEVKAYWVGGNLLREKIVKRSLCCQVHSCTHPYLTYLRSQMYHEGHKYVTEQVINQLDPLAIAVWYMDDGGIYLRKPDTHHHSAYPLLILNTQSFDHDSNLLVATYFRDMHGIRFGIHQSRGWRLVSSDSKSIDAFIALVRPHILPYFAFKVL